MHGLWPNWFLKEKEPSIKYLELFALCGAILTWGQFITDTRVIVFCDNQAVVEMINNTSSRYKNCMILIRKLVLNNLKFNRRVFTRYINMRQNILADSLSRDKIKLFKKLAPKDIAVEPSTLTTEMWPISKVWID